MKGSVSHTQLNWIFWLMCGMALSALLSPIPIYGAYPLGAAYLAHRMLSFVEDKDYDG